jgi:hypothetical protein
MPMRWLYPSSETDYNRENLEEALDRQFDGYDEVNNLMWILRYFIHFHWGKSTGYSDILKKFGRLPKVRIKTVAAHFFIPVMSNLPGTYFGLK